MTLMRIYSQMKGNILKKLSLKYLLRLLVQTGRDFEFSMKIIDKQDREVLSEGRNYGMGFAFLKELKTNEFETICPISPCKDYLNDVVYGEALNVPVSACGLNYKPVGGVFEEPFSNLVIKITNYQKKNTFSKYANFETDTKQLKTNYKNIEKLLNYIETRIGIDHTEITPSNDDMYHLKVPRYWTESTYLTSLYALLVRMGQYYDGKKEPVEFLNNYPTNNIESSLWNSAKLKLIMIMNGYKIKQTFDKKTGGAIHGSGILAYNDFKI